LGGRAHIGLKNGFFIENRSTPARFPAEIFPFYESGGNRMEVANGGIVSSWRSGADRVDQGVAQERLSVGAEDAESFQTHGTRDEIAGWSGPASAPAA
jgi:hypothetical protein